MHVPAATTVSDTPSVPAYSGVVPRQFGWIAPCGYERSRESTSRNGISP